MSTGWLGFNDIELIELMEFMELAESTKFIWSIEFMESIVRRPEPVGEVGESEYRFGDERNGGRRWRGESLPSSKRKKPWDRAHLGARGSASRLVARLLRRTKICKSMFVEDSVC